MIAAGNLHHQQQTGHLHTLNSWTDVQCPTVCLSICSMCEGLGIVRP